MGKQMRSPDSTQFSGSTQLQPQTSLLQDNPGLPASQQQHLIWKAGTCRLHSYSSFTKHRALSERGKAFPQDHSAARHRSRDLLRRRMATSDRSTMQEIPCISRDSFSLDIAQCTIKSWHIWEMVHGEVVNSSRGSGGTSLCFPWLRN